MDNVLKSIQALKNNLPDVKPLVICGQLVQSVGLLLEARGCKAGLGTICEIETLNGVFAQAEVVGFKEQRILLTVLDSNAKFEVGAKVRALGHHLKIPCGPGLIGRVINGVGEVLDEGGPLKDVQYKAKHFEKINPLRRMPIRSILDVGIKTINSLLTIGQGQRIGLFAGSGVGKSVLLGMMAKGTTADVIVVGLIGERGREVKEFIEEILGPEGLKKAVLIVSPADESAMLRLYGAETATLIAEYFRDQGKNVLLLMDSLTRYAQAIREISLAAGEPPATKGYTPSVFAKLPALVERAGNGKEGGGSITAIYTVLVEGDDVQEPIADAARAILDGHIVLNRSIAEEGIYPAIDVEASISRVMNAVVNKEHQKIAVFFKKILSSYQRNIDLIRIGAYKRGSDPLLDIAIEMHDKMNEFLTQAYDEKKSFKESYQLMTQLLKNKMN